MGGVDEESVPGSRGLGERFVKWKVRWRGVSKVPQALVAELRQAVVLKNTEKEHGKSKAMTIESRGRRARWRKIHQGDQRWWCSGGCVSEGLL
jgi:hypothetical protein